MLPAGELQLLGHEGWIPVTRQTIRIADDLVLLHVDASQDLSPYQVPTAAKVRPGVTVFSSALPGRDVTAGIVARSSFAEPRLPPTLGCSLEQTDDGRLVVAEVVASSAAADAELPPGDILQTLSGRQARQCGDVAAVLEQVAPGDRIEWEYLRANAVRTATSRLQPAASALLDRTEFLDGRSGALSDRRTGFADVFQHDVRLTPADMGTAVVNQQGEVVGLNIAVRSREAIIALPWPTVRSLLSHD